MSKTKLWTASWSIFWIFFLPAAVPLLAQEHPRPLASAPQTSARQLSENLARGQNILILDVRSPKEYAAGHIPGSRNIPLEELIKGIQKMKLAKDTAIVTVCDHGGRSSRAVKELQKLGYQVTSFCTLDSWKKEHYRIETGDGKPGSKVYKFICRHYCLADIQTKDLDATCTCACGKPYRECMRGS
jgi:rhodanese-related sulfurtransferase